MNMYGCLCCLPITGAVISVIVTDIGVRHCMTLLYDMVMLSIVHTALTQCWRDVRPHSVVGILPGWFKTLVFLSDVYC